MKCPRDNNLICASGSVGGVRPCQGRVAGSSPVSRSNDTKRISEVDILFVAFKPGLAEA